MASITNINGTEYKIASGMDEIRSIGDLPEGLRVYISNAIQHGLAKNKTVDEIMNGLVIKNIDGRYYLKTNHEAMLLSIEAEVAEAIRSIMTGEDV